MTHKEKQGLTALAIVLCLLLGIMRFCGGHGNTARDSAPSAAALLSATADSAATTPTDTVAASDSCPSVSTTPPHRKTTRSKRPAARPSTPAPDRESPLDNPVGKRSPEKTR